MTDEILKIEQINGYFCLPIVLPTVNFKSSSNSKSKLNSKDNYHYTYLRKHQIPKSNNNSKELINESERSLFFINLPKDTTNESMKDIFHQIGGGLIEKITYGLDYDIDIGNLSRIDNIDENDGKQRLNLPRDCGLITMVDKSACSLTINQVKKIHSKKINIPKWPNLSSLSGKQYYLSQYKKNFPSSDSLSNNVNSFMIEFNKLEEERLNNIKSLKNKIDDDGFELVVSNKRKSSAGLNLIRKRDDDNDEVTLKRKKKNEKKEKKDFYKFQIREVKKEKVNRLVLKFHEDQDKIKKLKERRLFKPF